MMSYSSTYIFLPLRPLRWSILPFGDAKRRWYANLAVGINLPRTILPGTVPLELIMSQILPGLVDRSCKISWLLAMADPWWHE